MWSLAGSAALLFYAVFFGQPLFDEDGFHARPARIGLFFAAGAMWIGPLGFGGIVASSVPIVELASMPLMLVLYQLMLRARLLAGGADAKCLMALTLLVPTYPHASPFPLFATDPRVQLAFQALFPFSFVVLVDAAVLQLVVPLGLFICNLTRGDVVTQSFLGYRAALDRFPKHVRLMERITDRGDTWSSCVRSAIWIPGRRSSSCVLRESGERGSPRGSRSWSPSSGASCLPSWREICSL